MHELSVVIPCYNEEETLRHCVQRVSQLEDDDLRLQIIIVDDASQDKSYEVANQLKHSYPNLIVARHTVNKGKGAALRTGFQSATGDFVVVQDADLEYNPLEIKNLLAPIIDNKADVVYGSRFLTTNAHRVLYYWHSLGNSFLTTVSNMFTDLNLSDMETCYKVFRREIIQSITLEEDRFGFEPEVTAKIAQKRCRVYEMGISYDGRTYEEGKKIGWKDGVRALYCIFKYSAHVAPLPIQFLIYIFIGGVAALFNLLLFLVLLRTGSSLMIATPVAFAAASILNYYLSIAILFRKNVKWGTFSEIVIYSLVVVVIAAFDYFFTVWFVDMGYTHHKSKIYATILGLILNFLGRKYIVFPEKKSGAWQRQVAKPVKKVMEKETQNN